MGIFSRWFNRATRPASPPVVVVRARIEGPAGGPPPGYVTPYLDAESAAELLRTRIDGSVPLHMQRHRGEWWLAEDSTRKLVNVTSRQLRELGVWAFRIRGERYAKQSMRVGAVALVREPENVHDANAVAIHQGGAHCGYVNKQKARGLARVLDAGETLTAQAISSTKVIACEPRLFTHIMREGGPAR